MRCCTDPPHRFGPLRCSFDELSLDNPHNQVLKAVLHRLLPQCIGGRARAAVSRLLHYLSDVSSVPCSTSDIERLSFNRLTRSWGPLFERAG